MTNEELKKETKNESKTDSLSSIIKVKTLKLFLLREGVLSEFLRLSLFSATFQALKSLAGKLQKSEDVVRDLETFRLKMIFRY